MRPELRFVLAIFLMVGVLFGTNVLFPPPPAPEAPVPSAVEGEPEPAEPTEPAVSPSSGTATAAPDPPVVPERRIRVRGPLYEFEFSNYGAQLHSAMLPGFRSFADDDGPVQLLLRNGPGALGSRVAVAGDTLDFSVVPFEVSPAEGLALVEGDDPQELSFTFRSPDGRTGFEIHYRFDPDSYLIDVRGRVLGVDRGLLLTDLGQGLAFNEARPADDEQALAYVVNHTQDGIRQRPLRNFEEDRVEDGPLLWVALKSKYFLAALLAGEDRETERFLGGVFARRPVDLYGGEEPRVSVTAAQSLLPDDSFAYRVYLGPQDFTRLRAIGGDLEDVNPVGWRWLRPVIQPFAAIITTILIYLHNQLGWGYGWVLILFGVMMRVVLFPLNQKAMRAQLRNTAVAPMVKEIQAKYKNDPERQQKEMMKLYREHGFNPLAGCVPMLIPFPVLITLFFVFQNTIELRGVSFLWLPDLSAPDPLYLLPVFLGVSMFLLQWVSMRTMDQVNPQMKMMLWFMPIFMVFIFFQLASGLNLYYATANIATLPQQYWIARERQKAKNKAS
ncbi:MAG: membrane protein insertase YidC [Gammaproteobacteria bacterium]|nr:membrane protein insertase YidC [Gammaproteobacteria bacterium]